LNNIGFLYSEINRPEDLESCLAAGDRQGQSVALGNIANILQALESQAEALAHYREAITIDRHIGFLPHESCMQQQLGRTLLALDRAAAATVEGASVPAQQTRRGALVDPIRAAGLQGSSCYSECRVIGAGSVGEFGRHTPSTAPRQNESWPFFYAGAAVSNIVPVDTTADRDNQRRWQ